MAESTAAIKGYTFWGILIGAMGLVLLARTLVAKSNAATAAFVSAKTAENAARAHLYAAVEPEYKIHDKDTITEFGNRHMCFTTKVSIKNYGSTPAENVFIRVSPEAIDRGVEGAFDLPSENWLQPYEKRLPIIGGGGAMLQETYVHHDTVDIRAIYEKRILVRFLSSRLNGATRASLAPK